MNPLEFEDVNAVLSGLWPKQAKDMSNEILRTWRRVCEGFNAPAVIAELRGWAESSRYCPHPSEIRERLQAKRNSNAGAPRGVKPSQSIQDWYRLVWAKKDPGNELHYRNMSDHDVDLQCLAWAFRRCAEVYGPSSGEASHAWQAWQCKARGQDVSIESYTTDPTGQANAIRIHGGNFTGQAEAAA